MLFFFEAEDGIRDDLVTGVQTWALPICELKDDGLGAAGQPRERAGEHEGEELVLLRGIAERDGPRLVLANGLQHLAEGRVDGPEIGRASCRERVERAVARGGLAAKIAL